MRFHVRRKSPSRLKNNRGQAGQAMVEYILVLLLAFSFAHFIYFHKTFGIQPNFDKMMLRLGSYLEGNLKAGTRNGEQGHQSSDAFAGTGTWTN